MKTTFAIKKEIPAAFLGRMAGLLKDEYPNFLECLQLPAVAGLRVNTLKCSVSEFLDLSQWNLSPVPWSSSGFIINPQNQTYQPQPGKHPYHAAGLYYLQEPSAMAAAEILTPQPGEKILDLAAAPGGKTTHLASLMNNTGLLVANEIHPKRVLDLVENLERCGVTGAIITNETPQKLADHLGEYFDRVLLDAPCSGEGMFRKGHIARQEWSPQHVHSCAIRQVSILEDAARLVKPGGCLVYTTCTFSPDENEGVIARFLDRHAEFEPGHIPNLPGFSRARPEWADLPIENRINRAVRIWPHLAQGEGHFIALLVKHQSSEVRPSRQTGMKNRSRPDKKGRIHPGKHAWTIMEPFFGSHFDIKLNPDQLANIGPHVYLIPEIAPDLTGLSIIRPGWWLGTIQHDQFIPSHSLVLGLNKNQARNSITFRASDATLAAYLAGESLSDTGDNNWVVVCVDGYPIAWAKRVHHVLKNFYPHLLRRQR